MNNIFDDIPNELPQELFTQLLQQDKLKIERIVSKGHATPAGEWYNQTQDEWVLLLQGQAILAYEQHSISLIAGDIVFIPAHTKHRVEWTAPDILTIWLVIHLYK